MFSSTKFTKTTIVEKLGPDGKVVERTTTTTTNSGDGTADAAEAEKEMAKARKDVDETMAASNEFFDTTSKAFDKLFKRFRW